MQSQLNDPYEKILRSPDTMRALIDHFQILVDGEETQDALKRVMACVRKTRIEDRKLVLEFFNGLFLVCHGPKQRDYQLWPPSFQRIMKVHSMLEYGCGDQNLSPLFVLGDHGSCLFEDEDFDDSKSPMIDNCSDWWIYDSTPLLEPNLRLISHGSLSIIAQTNHSVGHLFLERLLSTFQ